MKTRKELIVGGQRSGKSARAEQLAAQWLQRSPSHRTIYVATAQAHDEEMHQRIVRHQQDRAERIPSMLTIEDTDISAQLLAHNQNNMLVVVDCLTLWLTNLLMPWKGPAASSEMVVSHTNALLQAIATSNAHIILVSNEIGLGTIAPSRETRIFVDALGHLNQRVAAVCSHVTFMAAGLALALKPSDRNHSV